MENSIKYNETLYFLFLKIPRTEFYFYFILIVKTDAFMAIQFYENQSYLPIKSLNLAKIKR